MDSASKVSNIQKGMERDSIVYSFKKIRTFKIGLREFVTKCKIHILSENKEMCHSLTGITLVLSGTYDNDFLIKDVFHLIKYDSSHLERTQVWTFKPLENS